MAFKFALIVVLACVAQGYSKDVAEQQNPCTAASQTAQELQLNFEEAMNQMDELREYVSIASLEAYFKGVDPIVVLRCMGAQRESYIKLGQHIAELLEIAAEKMINEIGSQYDKITTRAVIALRTIAITVRTLPTKVIALIQNKEFNKAYELIKEARLVVETNVKIVIQVVEELRVDIPEAADKVIEMAKEIRGEAQKGSQAIVAAFTKCVEEGGPKKSAETDSETNES